MVYTHVFWCWFSLYYFWQQLINCIWSYLLKCRTGTCRQDPMLLPYILKKKKKKKNGSSGDSRNDMKKVMCVRNVSFDTVSKIFLFWWCDIFSFTLFLYERLWIATGQVGDFLRVFRFRERSVIFSGYSGFATGRWFSPGILLSREVGDFLRVFRFPPPLKLTATI